MLKSEIIETILALDPDLLVADLEAKTVVELSDILAGLSPKSEKNTSIPEGVTIFSGNRVYSKSSLDFNASSLPTSVTEKFLEKGILAES